MKNSQISDISSLSSLTNLSTLWLSNNPVLENMSREEIREVLSGAENLIVHVFGIQYEAMILWEMNVELVA